MPATTKYVLFCFFLMTQSIKCGFRGSCAKSQKMPLAMSLEIMSLKIEQNLYVGPYLCLRPEFQGHIWCYKHNLPKCPTELPALELHCGQKKSQKIFFLLNLFHRFKLSIFSLHTVITLYMFLHFASTLLLPCNQIILLKYDICSQCWKHISVEPM